MKLIEVPRDLDERAFDPLVAALVASEGERVLFDARHTRWLDPYGMLGLLALGSVAGRAGGRPRLQLPAAAEVQSYLGRMGFLEHAEPIWELHGALRRGPDPRAENPSDVLLEITPVRSHADVHAVVDRVHERAIVLLSSQLGYPRSEAVQFSVILSEVCQNIIEHSGAEGWVAAQTYSRTRQLARRVVRIAVVDVGMGFKASLASTHATRFGERWNDATALEAAFIHGLTRFHDPGRGQGLQQIRRNVGRWGGKVSIRSGTARIADIPDYDTAPPLEENLPPFPGAQIFIELPARVAPADAAAATGSATRRRAGQ
ncbi:MAG TPA: hypothetical protein VIL18_03825 [Longimicrobiales bacterium]